MRLSLSTLNCVGHYDPNRKGWEIQPSQREMQLKYHPKKPLSREIANAKFQRIMQNPRTTEILVFLGFFNSVFAGHTVLTGSAVDTCVPGYHLDGKAYTRNTVTNKCFMWTVPFNKSLNGPVDVYGSRPDTKK